MMIHCNGYDPKMGADNFVAPSAQLIGNVTTGKQCSFWFNTVIRGDVSPITIGDKSNIQDGTIIHGTFEKCSVEIGSEVSIGHAAIIHGCTIEDRVLVGMGSIIMDGSRVSRQSIVGAGSLITEGKEFPENSLIMGRPAKVVRELKPEEIQWIDKTIQNYLKYQTWYSFDGR